MLIKQSKTARSVMVTVTQTVILPLLNLDFNKWLITIAVIKWIVAKKSQIPTFPLSFSMSWPQMPLKITPEIS